ncbi:hypothetical protein GCM10023186_15440 [Hymenobacter koreensis]|uniref:Uncharacterized protein n=1 Tax=Hymenobacter koreensis TaxID=1084523 RepID=A0ABP8IXH4_9BACT
MPANFQQLGRGEELHVGGVTDNGVNQSAFVDDSHRKAAPLNFDGASKAYWARADDDYVEKDCG